MTDTLTIAQLGNSVLRQTAQPIGQKIVSFHQLIDKMLDVLKAHNGVGLAAPQISESVRLLIVASAPNARYPDAPMMEPTAMIDPTIVDRSDNKVKDWEGCLSIPGIRGWVPRYQFIDVEYTDRQGTSQKTRLNDFVARIFQHELDHLDGIVFLDRLESNRDIITDYEYLKLVQGQEKR